MAQTESPGEKEESPKKKEKSGDKKTKPEGGKKGRRNKARNTAKANAKPSAVQKAKKPKKKEMPISKEELFEKVNALLEKKGRFIGTASALGKALPGVKLSPSVLSRMLRKEEQMLLSRYAIHMKKARTHKDRLIELTKEATYDA